jgi:hypothetical protein
MKRLMQIPMQMKKIKRLMQISIHIKKIQQDKGKTFVMVLIFSSIVIVLCSALFFVLLSEAKSNDAMAERETAIYIAYSGIEHGVNIIVNTPENEELVKPDGAITIYDSGDTRYEYQVMELATSYVEAVGRIIKNGNVTMEVTLTASVDEAGEVGIVKKQ